MKKIEYYTDSDIEGSEDEFNAEDEKWIARESTNFAAEHEDNSDQKRDPAGLSSGAAQVIEDYLEESEYGQVIPTVSSGAADIIETFLELDESDII
jgi:hypothetical protein